MSLTHPPSTRSVDPVLRAVIANRMRAIGQRMGVVIERSARSPLLVEGRDFSLALYDHAGRLLEQTEFIPILGYATAPAMREICREYAGDVHEGDVILHNDPFAGGNQASDWKVAKPVFVDGHHVAWTVVTAHQADVGGSVPGSYNPDARDVWQEALRIPPVKIHERGQVREDVWRLILANVRMPVVGDDVDAMIGACTVGERELVELIRRYGTDTWQAAMEEILDATEVLARRVIAEIADGTYSAESIVYDDAVDPYAEMTIRTSIAVRGDRMTVDFTGTDPQTRGYVNAPLPVTMSSVLIAFFMIVGEDIPHNDAIMRCVEVVVPEGTMLNPRFPAASGFGNHLSDQICAAIMEALAPVLPDRITAGWNRMLSTIITGRDPRSGRQYVDILINASKGGGGGTRGADGYDHIGLIASGGAIAAQDPEMFEALNPCRIRKFEYLRDSAGPGRWRGGLGVETEIELLGDDTQASVFGDGIVPGSQARGLLGGADGIQNEAELRYPDGPVRALRGKELVSDIPRGTVYRQIAGGGGGFGDPRERPAAVVKEEVKDGYVSAQAAREQYGVVVSDAGELDEAATDRRRDASA